MKKIDSGEMEKEALDLIARDKEKNENAKKEAKEKEFQRVSEAMKAARRKYYFPGFLILCLIASMIFLKMKKF